MLYSFLKLIVKIALKVFYKSTKINNKDFIPKKGPMIIVTNHPNTFMDPLVVAGNIKPQVYFLANSSIFGSGIVKKILKKLHMIPIQRKIDTNKEKVDNNKIFEQCYNFLGKGGTLLIFPEGTSIRERRLRKLKTGTARIALGAMAKYNFDVDLKIVTIGLNYSNPESFRSEVFLNVDEAISVKDFKGSYEKDDFQAAVELTEKIREQLEEHIIVTKNEIEDRLAKEIETVYKPQLSEELHLSDKEKEQDFLISQGIVDAVHHFETHEPERIKAFRPKIDAYLNDLERVKLSDEYFKKEKQGKSIFWASLQTLLYFVLGFPLFIYGLLNNYIPYIIPSQVAAKIVKLSKVEEYTAPVMMITGIFSFGFFYPLQIILFQVFFKSFWLTLAYTVSLPLSGFFTLFYANYLHTTRDKWRLLSLFFKRTSLVSQLIQNRKDIITSLEKAKEDYLKFYEKIEEV